MSDFHLLLEEEIPRLMRYAAALTRNPDEAEELVADAIREALARQRHQHSDLRVWLLTILHDLRGNPFRIAFGAAAPVVEPDAPLTLSQLDRALGRLPEEQRAVILLIGLEGFGYGDAAAVLRITPGALRSRLARGRAALRRAVGVETAPRVARAA